MKVIIITLAIATLTAATASFAFNTVKAGETHIKAHVSRLQAAEAEALK